VTPRQPAWANQEYGVNSRSPMRRGTWDSGSQRHS